MATVLSEDKFQLLKNLFGRDVCQKATAPLKDGTEIALYICDALPVTLSRKGGALGVFSTAPAKPDLSFYITEKTLLELNAFQSESVTEIGIEIVKHLIQTEEDNKIKVKIHIGMLDFLFKGYLGILTSGGPDLMKFLATKGLGSISKIKDAISKMRSKE